MTALASATVVPHHRPLPVVWFSRALLATIALLAACLVGLHVQSRLLNPEGADVLHAASDPAGFAALKALSPDERKLRIAASARALFAEPLDRGLINGIAALAASGDDDGLAETMAMEGAARSFRDPQAQLSAMRIHFGQKKFAEGLRNADGLLRARPQLAAGIHQGLLPLVNDPQGVDALAATLAALPPWRAGFFAAVLAADASGQMAQRLSLALRRAGASLRESELRLLIEQQFAAKAQERAYFYWLDSLDDAALAKARNIFDGGFSLEPHNLFFDWNILPLASGDVGVGPRPGSAADGVLRVTMFDSRERFAHVFQFLRLDPGTYAFHGEASVDFLQSGDGLVWRAYCSDGLVIGESEVFGPRSPWHGFSFGFTVPGKDCSTQFVRLEGKSGVAAGNRFDGTAYFDNLAVDKPAPQP